MEENDRALLRRFEPVIRYTQGEQFFPMDVELYVRSCSLWMQQPGRAPRCLVPAGRLTLEKLAQPHVGGPYAVYFLKFIEPLDLPELAAYQFQQRLRHKEPQETFRAGRGRLARVGYISRLGDALFSLTLLARGRVPGGIAAAAAIEYNDIMAEREHYVYYGRVTRQNGWIALQYWFFYAFNNWRSGFYGASDHEGDWEMIYVYLCQTGDGDVCPEWVAYASHDYSGDDLRRHWDDTELEKVGEHPVIYAGAGSHASYFARGEYLAEIELGFLAPAARVLRRVRETTQRALGQQRDPRAEGEQDGYSIFRIPFVDYARGDGLVVGPSGQRQWEEPRLLDPPPAWVTNFRGLWGLYAQDPAAVENAPAGPMYRRDGTVRRSWYDPLGWSGLDKVPPPNRALDRVWERQEELHLRRAELSDVIHQKSQELGRLGVEAQAMRGYLHLRDLRTAHRAEIARLSEELDRLRAELAADQALLEALERHAERLAAGEPGPLRAHIRRAYRPASYEELRLSRLAETWAAISIGLMAIAFVILVFVLRENPVVGVMALLSLMIFIESSFRRRLSQLISSVTIGLAAISTLVLIYQFFWPIVALAVLVAGGYVVWENVREL